MKTVHLILGLTIVLVLSLAMPALGGPLGPFASDSQQLAQLKSMVKRAQKAAVVAQRLAGAAQSTTAVLEDAAGRAERTASSAQGTASSAQSAASAAQGSADAARTIASSAQSAATDVQSRVDGIAATASQAKTAANSALAAVGSKFGKVEEFKVPAPPPNPSNHEAEAKASCPPETEVIGGGFLIFNGAAEPHLSLPVDNGWFVAAQSAGNNFKLEVIAMCLSRREP